MANSLFDQLKKSGLVDDKKAKKVKKEKHQAKKQADKGKKKGPQVDEVTLLAQQAQAEKVAKDRELNRQRKEEADRKAVFAQIKQLIDMNRIKNRDGDLAYNFANEGKVERIYLKEAFQMQLAKGQLAIVSFGEGFELVPTAVAEKIAQRDEKCVIYCDSAQHDEAKDDDPYADYAVPDDLMW